MIVFCFEVHDRFDDRLFGGTKDGMCCSLKTYGHPDSLNILVHNFQSVSEICQSAGSKCLFTSYIRDNPKIISDKFLSEKKCSGWEDNSGSRQCDKGNPFSGPLLN